LAWEKKERERERERISPGRMKEGPIDDRPTSLQATSSSMTGSSHLKERRIESRGEVKEIFELSVGVGEVTR
jgi:hypothetical protein